MKALARILALVVFPGLLISPAQADRKSREEEKAREARFEEQRQQVLYVLQKENAGRQSDRKQALKELIASGDVADEVYWQAGYIKRGDDWVSVGDRWLSPEQEQNLKEYTKARSNAVDSDEGHYRLAQWCAENGFDAQAYAHLKAVLLNNPDHAGLRHTLGYQKIGERWMNAEDYEAAVREADRLAKELREWGPKVAAIRNGLQSPDPRDRNRAKVRLKEITEVAAVPALELILLPASDVSATVCVDQLCRIDHRRSSIALCKAAIFLPESSASTKQAAIDELRSRPLEDFVPELLLETSTPLNHRICCFIDYCPGIRGQGVLHRDIAPNRVVVRTIAENENHLTTNRLVKNNLFEIQFDVVEMPEGSGKSGMREPSHRISIASAGEQLQRDMLYRLRSNEKQIETVNEDIADRNAIVMQVLSEVTGNTSCERPEQWWQWWHDRLEVTVGNKPTNTQEVNEFNVVEVPMLSFPHSCFVAGTPVWTDHGPRPIEQLRVGDMALSKNVETGELMYRPIIRTTTRKPKPLVTIDLGAEQITATGGHPFWVTGEGWVRARELQAGQFLHTPTGTIRIDRVTETPDDATYNLIVDGFHTYFVGMSQALVHDVSITSPTDAVVPGLLDR